MLSEFKYFLKLPVICQIYILIQLPWYDFDLICYMKEFTHLHSDFPNSERFYQERANKVHSEYLEFKESNMKWKEFHQRIHMFLHSYNNYKTDRNYFSELIRDNKLLELKLNAKFHNQYPTIGDLYYAVNYGHIEILEWSESLQIYDYSKIDISCPEKNQIKILEFFERKKYLPQKHNITNYIINAEIETLEWLAKRGFDFKQTYVTLINGKLENLKWLYTKGAPFSYILGGLVLGYYGRIDIVEWLISIDPKFTPGPQSGNDAAERGHLSALIWLEEKGIKFKDNIATLAYLNQQYRIVAWLEKRGIFVDKNYKKSLIGNIGNIGNIGEVD